MVNYNLPLYQNKPEKWNQKKCEQSAKHIASDGLGTKYPFKGYIGNHYGEIRYNGGTIKENEWWQGENRPLPIVHPDFKLTYRPTWGWQIVKK